MGNRDCDERARLLRDEMAGWSIEELVGDRSNLNRAADRLDQERESIELRSRVLESVLRGRLQSLPHRDGAVVRLGGGRVIYADPAGNIHIRAVVDEPAPAAVGGAA